MQTLKPMPNLTLAVDPTTVKRWTVQDYHRMSEMGILANGNRLIMPIARFHEF